MNSHTHRPAAIPSVPARVRVGLDSIGQTRRFGFLSRRRAVAAVFAAGLCALSGSAAANTTNNYTGSATGNVPTGSNWSLGTAPTITNDAVFPVGAATGIRNFGTGVTPGATSVTWGSLNDLSTGTTITLRNDTSGASTVTLTLGGVGNLGNSVSGNAADLFYVATGGTMNITGPGVTAGSLLNLALGQSGNFNIAGTGSSFISSVISDGGSGFGITKTGAGALSLAGTNTYTGRTTVAGGNLFLDYTTNGVANILSSSSPLTVAGGTFIMGSKANTALAQTVNGTTFGASASQIITSISSTTLVVGRAASSTPGLNLGALTRNVGATADVTWTAGTSGSLILGVGVYTSTTNTASGILAGFTAAGGTDWATRTGNGTGGASGQNHIWGFAQNGGSYNANTFAANTNNTDVTSNFTATTNATSGSVRFNPASAATLTLDGTNVIESGGILVTGTAGANATAIGGGTSLTSGNTKDLIVIQNNTNAAGAFSINAVIADNGGTSIALTKSGKGILILGGTNSFTGGVYLNGGVIQLNALGALNGNGINFGTQAATSYSAGAASGTLRLNSNSVSVASLSTANVSVGTSIVENANAIGATLTVNSSTSNTFNGVLQDGTGGGALSLTKQGVGILTLSGANTYIGATQVNAGTLAISGSGTLGTGSALTLGGGTLALGGTSQTVGAVSITTAAASGNTIENGSLTGTSYTASNTAGDATVTVNLLANGAAGLTKTGAGGTLILSSANTYTGATLVNGGTLTIDHSGGNLGALGNTAVTVNGGNTLLVKGTTSIGGALTSSGIVSLVDTTVNTLTLGGGVSLSNSTLNLNLGNANGSADLITTNGAVTIAGTNTINLSLAAGASVQSGTYTLINVVGGGLTAGGSGFTIGSRPSGFYTLALSSTTSTQAILTISATATPGTAYWTGLASTTGSPTDPSSNWGYGSALGTAISNWSSNSAGTIDTLQVPGTTTDVIFTASNATPSSGTTLITQLDSGYSIKSLTFNVPSATTIISTAINTNSSALTLGSGGLTLASGSNASATISGGGSVIINGDQNWANNNNTQSLTVNTGLTALSGVTVLSLNGTGTGGVILGGIIGNGTATSLGVVFNQAGATQLNASNSFTGGVTINSGTLQLGNAGALNSTTPNPLAFGASSTGMLQLNGNNVTVSGLNTNPTVGTPVVESGSGTAGTDTLTVNTTSANTYAGVLRNGPTRLLALTKSGAGALTLTGANTYTGVTTIGAGTLSVATIGDGAVVSGNLGTATNAAGNLVFDGGTLQYTGATASTNRNFTINAEKTATFDITVNNLTVSGASTSTSGALTKIGAGTLTLSGANQYTGLTTIAEGTVSFSADNNLGTSAAAVSLNGGTLKTTAAITDTHVITVGGLGGGINVNGGNSLYLNAANRLLGSGALTLTGGTLRIDQTNTYNGNITIQSSGLFEYGITNAVASAGAMTVNSTGEIALQSQFATTLANNISVDGGTLSFETFSTPTNLGNYSGQISLATGGGTIALRNWYNAGAASGKITGKITGNGALTIAGAGALTLSGSTSDYTSATTVNTNITVLVGANSIGLPGSVTAGPIGTNTLNLAGGTFGSSADALTIANAINATAISTIGQNANLSVTLSGALSGNGTLKNFNSGTLNQGNVFLTGNLSAFTGTLEYSGSNTNSSAFWRVGTGNSTIDLSGAILNLVVGTGSTKNFGFKDDSTGNTLKVGALTGGGTFQASHGSGANTLEVGAKNSDTIFSGTIGLVGSNTANVALTKVGSGTLTLTGANPYTGGTAVKNGSLVLDGGTNRLLATGSVVLGDNATAGKLVLGGTAVADQTLAGLMTTGSGGSVVGGNGSNSTLALNIASGNNTFGGTLGGPGTNENKLALTKSGGGALILSGANTYAGPTLVSGGRLEISGSLTNTSGIQVDNTGTLLLSGGSEIVNSANVNLNGGTLSFSNSSNLIETLGNLTLNADSTINFGTGDSNTFNFGTFSISGSNILSIWNWTGTRYDDPPTANHGGTQDRLIFSADPSSQPLSQIRFYSGEGSGFIGTGAQINFSGYEIVPVPEPASTAGIGSLGLCALIGFRERRRFIHFAALLKGC